MNKQPKLWELLAAVLPVIVGFSMWIWNLGTTVKEQGKDIEYLKANQLEYKKDVKEINENLKTILIRMESKQDRKP